MRRYTLAYPYELHKLHDTSPTHTVLGQRLLYMGFDTNTYTAPSNRMQTAASRIFQCICSWYITGTGVARITKSNMKPLVETEK